MKDGGMVSFPIPSNERERLKELRRLRIDQGGASGPLNEICAIAAKLIGTSISHVSLIDEHEQLFAGQVGLDVDRTARRDAICAHTIMTSKPLVAENADNDPRFSRSPLVATDPGVKSYLGIPLEVSPGIQIGALCVVDRKPRRFNDDDVRTLQGLGQIAVSIIKSHRMSEELDEQLASAIALQKDMLPSAVRIAQIQAHCPVDLSSYYNPRDGIGGDIWGVEATGPRRIMMYIADFTGHGVAAALNAARFHSFVHMAWQRTQRPASLLQRLNRRLCEVLPTGQFATMFCVMIDFAMHKLEYASAGAPPQLYRASPQLRFEVISQSSLPLGILNDVVYESETVPFHAGGVLALYTDGLVETPRPPNSMLTTDGLRELLDNEEQKKDAGHICRNVVDRLFSAPLTDVVDDITLIIAKHTGAVGEPVSDYEV